MAGAGGAAGGAAHQEQPEQHAPAPLSFADFLERMKEPAAADLVRAIKAFIRQFEERGQNYRIDPEADSVRVQVCCAALSVGVEQVVRPCQRHWELQRRVM